MTAVTHDDRVVGPGGAGLGLAAVSALAFGLSGVFARPLLASGWSPGAVVLIRIVLGALVVLPLGLRALDGRWHLLRRHGRLIVTYGLLAVAGAQFCYFSAVSHMQVGPALLIEYTAPAAIVVWLWVRRGERPGRVTLVGAGICAVGLLFVLDLFSGADLSAVGVAWAFAAMIGASAYFLISADASSELPPLTLAAGGLVTGGASLALLAVVGLLPMSRASEPVEYLRVTVDPWVPLVLLGVVTAALAYVTGIAAIRRLGSRVASFVALSEVVAGVVWAWLLLSELPAALQLFGGVLILVGVVIVKVGEKGVRRTPAAAVPVATEPPGATADPVA